MIEKVIEKVIAYFVEELDDPELEIRPDSNLMDDLSLSSLEMLKSLVHLETEMGVTIPEKFLRKMFTIEDVAKVICEVLDQKEMEG